MRRVRTGYAYDSALDPFASKAGRKMLAIFRDTPQWKKELGRDKGKATFKKNHAKQALTREAAQSAREVAEEGAAETVRLAVRAMQQALLVLQDTPAPNQYRRAINPHVVHNAVLLLRTKSGVTFPPDTDEQFTHKEAANAHVTGSVYVPLWERDKQPEDR